MVVKYFQREKKKKGSLVNVVELQKKRSEKSNKGEEEKEKHIKSSKVGKKEK